MHVKTKHALVTGTLLVSSKITRAKGVSVSGLAAGNDGCFHYLSDLGLLGRCADFVRLTVNMFGGGRGGASAYTLNLVSSGLVIL